MNTEREVQNPEKKELGLTAFLHVKKGQSLPDCPFQLKVKDRTNVDVILGDGSATKKV